MSIAKQRPHSTRRAACLVPLLALTVLAPVAAQLPPPPVPAGNPITPEKVNLGKALFWEEHLSSTRSVSCGTCHHAGAGGSDPRTAGSLLSINPGVDGIYGTDDDIAGSRGVPRTNPDGTYIWDANFGFLEQVTGRKANSTTDAAYASLLFWDGRAAEEFRDPETDAVVIPIGAALESQALGPPTSDVEMGHVGRDWPAVAAQIETAEPLGLAETVPASLVKWIDGRDYPALFNEVFGTPDVTPVRIAMAIATYQRTLFSNQTPFDDFLAGNASALTALEMQGRDVFRDKNCDTCHRGVLTADNRFHYTGVRPVTEDPGRFDVTGVEEDRGTMRTPPLRNVETRAPYFHTGQAETLEDVIDFYNRGGDHDHPNKSPLIVPLGMSEAEQDALLAFITRPLTDPRAAAETAPFDRPTLYGESDRVPTIGSDGTAGDGGFVPEPVAFEPAYLGNPSFTVGVFGGLGGASATLVIDTVDPGIGAVPGAGSFAFENVTLGGTGAGNGFSSVSLAVPMDPNLHGTTLFGRWYVADPAAAGGVAVSHLFTFRAFAPIERLFADDFETNDFSAWDNVVP